MVNFLASAVRAASWQWMLIILCTKVCMYYSPTVTLSFTIFGSCEKLHRPKNRKQKLCHSKGQLILKWFFGVVNFLQKTYKNKSTWGIICSSKVDFFFVRFLGELRISKNPSEINWTLLTCQKFHEIFFICTFIVISNYSIKRGQKSPSSVLFFFQLISFHCG